MMPIYSYICRECGHEESKMVDSKNRDTEVECSECSTLSLDRVQTKLPQHNHQERLPSDKEDFHKHKSGIDITK